MIDLGVVTGILENILYSVHCCLCCLWVQTFLFLVSLPHFGGADLSSTIFCERMKVGNANCEDYALLKISLFYCPSWLLFSRLKANFLLAFGSYWPHWFLICSTLYIGNLAVTCVLFCDGSFYITQVDLEIVILLPLLPECWDYRCAPPCLTCDVCFLWKLLVFLEIICSQCSKLNEYGIDFHVFGRMVVLFCFFQYWGRTQGAKCSSAWVSSPCPSLLPEIIFVSACESAFSFCLS